MKAVEIGKPGSVDVILMAGASLAATITLKDKTTGIPLDLTGLTFTSQVRPDTSAKAPLSATIACTLNTPATDGIINLASDAVAALAQGDYAWDIWCPEWKRYAIRGSFSIIGSATRA